MFLTLHQIMNGSSDVKLGNSNLNSNLIQVTFPIIMLPQDQSYKVQKKVVFVFFLFLVSCAHSENRSSRIDAVVSLRVEWFPPGASSCVSFLHHS